MRVYSSYTSIHEDVEKLKKIFMYNVYPMKFVDRCIMKFFNRIQEKRIPVHNVPKRDLTRVLPFLGRVSYDVNKKLGEVIN